MPADPSMTFPATPDSVPTARRFVQERLEGCPEHVAQDVLLLTSELCTNCVVHARTSYVLRVRVHAGAVHVEVADGDPVLPSLTPGGRGLRLVDELASEWGADPAEGAGKVVWFDVRA